MYWENSLWGRRGEAAGSSENGKTFRNYEDFRKALEEYMLWYNQERIKEYLQWKSPIQALSTSITL